MCLPGEAVDNTNYVDMRIAQLRRDVFSELEEIEGRLMEAITEQVPQPLDAVTIVGLSALLHEEDTPDPIRLIVQRDGNRFGARIRRQGTGFGVQLTDATGRHVVTGDDESHETLESAVTAALYQAIVCSDRKGTTR